MPGKLQLLTAPQGPGCVVTILYREGITALSKTTPGPDTTSDCCLSHCCKLCAKLIGHKAQAVEYAHWHWANFLSRANGLGMHRVGTLLAQAAMLSLKGHCGNEQHWLGHTAVTA